MTLNEWTICPNCKFPAIMSELKKALAHEALCPMCEKPLTPAQLKFVIYLQTN
jgi:WD repeat-containing protein 19